MGQGFALRRPLRPPAGGTIAAYWASGPFSAMADVLSALVRPVSEPSWGKTTWVESIKVGLGGTGANKSCGGLSGVWIRKFPGS